MPDPELRPHPPAVVPNGMARVGPVMALPAVLSEYGVDAAAFLAEFGLEPAYFDEPENTLPMATLANLAGRGAKRTGSEHFGFEVGRRVTLLSFGTLGFLLKSAPTVGAAISLLHRYFALQSRGAEVGAENDGSFVTLSFAMIDRTIGHVAQVDTAAIACGVAILRGLVGPDWKPQAIRFAFAPPRDIAPLRHYFRVRPHFDAERSAMVFPSSLLDRAVPTADPQLYRIMEDRAHAILSRTRDGFADYVRRQLQRHASPAGWSLARTAAALGMHARTLNRALAAEGTTYLSLRDEVRFGDAFRLLRDTRMQVGEIAATLGYSDASSFTRAFQRWSGIGPSGWRQRQAAPPPAA